MAEIIIKYNESIELPNKKSFDYESPRTVLIYTSPYSYFVYNNFKGNCKVATISALQNCLEINKTFTLNRLDELINKQVLKLVFFCTFNDLRYVESLKEHYKLIYCNEVPIGYYNNKQYHCLFMTNNLDYPDYNKYLNKIIT